MRPTLRTPAGEVVAANFRAVLGRERRTRLIIPGRPEAYPLLVERGNYILELEGGRPVQVRVNGLRYLGVGATDITQADVVVIDRDAISVVIPATIGFVRPGLREGDL